MKQQPALNRKHWVVYLLLIFLPLTTFAQFERKIAIAASGQFDFGVSRYGTANTGVGLSAQFFFFAKNKVGLSVESSGDIFFGKELYFENGTRFRPSIVALRAGPNWFVTDRVFVTGLFGWASYGLEAHQSNSGVSYKFSVVRMLNKRKELLIRADYVGISRTGGALSYFSVGIGYAPRRSKN